MDKMLSITEYLSENHHNIDDLYLGKFWSNITDDLWIYIDNELISWLDYKDVKKGKEKVLKFLKKDFIEDDDYKLLTNDEFDINNFCSPAAGGQTNSTKIPINEEKRGAHNKLYIIVSPNSFKELCMLVGTKKSKEIKRYYINLEKVFKSYLSYQNEFNSNLLETKNEEIKQIKDDSVSLIKNNEIRTQSLLDAYIGKTIVYLAVIEKNVIKFGYSNKAHKRVKQHLRGFDSFEILFIQDCYNNLLIEEKIKQFAKDNDKLISKVIKDHNYTELIQIDDDFTLDVLIKKIKDIVNQQNMDDFEKLELSNVELQARFDKLELTNIELQEKLDSYAELQARFDKLELSNVELQKELKLTKYELSKIQINNENPEVTRSIPKLNKNVVIVKRYISENLIESIGGCESTEDIYNDFMNWCSDNNLYTTITAKAPLTTIIIANSNFKVYRKKVCGIRTNSLLHCKFI